MQEVAVNRGQLCCDLLRVAAAPDDVRGYVAANAPDLLAKLDVLTAEAAEDE